MDNNQLEVRGFLEFESGNYKESQALLEPLAASGSAYASFLLGWMTEVGALGDPDARKAELLYRDSVDGGYIPACHHLGRLLLSEERLEMARAIFEKGGVNGDSECSNVAIRIEIREAELLAFNLIEMRKYDDALVILNVLTRLNSKFALLTVGWLFERNLARSIERSVIVDHYSRVIAMGDEEGMYALGLLELQDGNEFGARKLFMDGANGNHVGCMTQYGMMLIDGRGGEQELDEGKKFLRMAMEAGDSLAKKQLLKERAQSSESIREAVIVLCLVVGVTLCDILQRIGGRRARSPHNESSYGDTLLNP